MTGKTFPVWRVDGEWYANGEGGRVVKVDPSQIVIIPHIARGPLLQLKSDGTCRHCEVDLPCYGTGDAMHWQPGDCIL